MSPALRVHHIAIICTDIEKAKTFYVEALGFRIIREVFRATRDSWKVDLDIDGSTQIELFTFPTPPARVSNPEACGLRHIAFEVDDLEATVAHLKGHNIEAEPIRVDEFTYKSFTFVRDPDGLPIELYER